MTIASRQATSALVQRAALRLFEKYGFDETTVDDIAEVAGISRRTFFRYFPSKSDILWADAGPVLQAMDEHLSNTPPEVPILDAILEASIACNALHIEGVAAHRQRMRLIHNTPALQAHRALRAADELNIIARFAARRLEQPTHALQPQVIAQLSMALIVASYDAWIADESTDFEMLQRAAFATIQLGPGVASSTASTSPDYVPPATERTGGGQASPAQTGRTAAKPRATRARPTRRDVE